MNQGQQNVVKFDGEDASSGYATPFLDLIAAGFLTVLSIVIMVASLRLPAPGGLLTAPGLLPFLIAASLLLMAVILGLAAWRRRSAGNDDDKEIARDVSEDMAALLLALTIAVYIAALQFLAFQYYIVVAGFDYTFSAFEPVTIVVLTVIIQISWRGPLWITTTVSIAWTILLSVVFQKVFLIPLPGGF